MANSGQQHSIQRTREYSDPSFLGHSPVRSRLQPSNGSEMEIGIIQSGEGKRTQRRAIRIATQQKCDRSELSRLTRKTFIQTNYDASSCYDRIIPSMAMVASRTFGVEKSITASNAMTLEKARYHIRTDMGLTDESYTHSPLFPIYGTGQGSGNSPAIWCFLSSVLYDLLR
jgi:hypothetical protein